MDEPKINLPHRLRTGNGFVVPEKYFDTLPKAILQNLPKKKSKILRKVVLYLSAAVVLMFLYLNFQGESDNVNGLKTIATTWISDKNDVAEYVLSTLDESDVIDLYAVSETTFETDTFSQNVIIDYLSEDHIDIDSEN